MSELTPAQKRVLAYMQKWPVDGLGYTARTLRATHRTMLGLERAGYVSVRFRSPLVDNPADGWYWRLTEKAGKEVRA